MERGLDVVYAMSYGDWIRREAAIRQMATEVLERELFVAPLSVAEYGMFSRSRAEKVLEELLQGLYAVTDFREQEVDRVGILGLSLTSTYLMRGTAIALRNRP